MLFARLSRNSDDYTINLTNEQIVHRVASLRYQHKRDAVHNTSLFIIQIIRSHYFQCVKFNIKDNRLCRESDTDNNILVFQCLLWKWFLFALKPQHVRSARSGLPDPN